MRSEEAEIEGHGAARPIAGAMGAAPMVSIVAVNYNGRRYLEEFLRSVFALAYPPTHFEVIVVDNGSTDGSVEAIRRLFPAVRIIETAANRGFAAGNNIGMRAAIGRFIVLINNDTVVDPNWLSALVEVASADPRVGMVGSKVLFLKPFLDVGIETETFNPAARNLSSDRRDLGLRILDARAEGCSYEKTIYREGFYSPEGGGGGRFRWTRGNARLAVPIEGTSTGCVLRLTVAGSPYIEHQSARVRIGDTVVGDFPVDAHAETLKVEVGMAVVRSEACDVINNAGSFLDATGRFGDRGIYEFERGQYNRVEDVPALCGVSMLLSRAMLDHVGMFDERFFMYFEDSDLCWRARRAGYRLVYTPHSRVRHVHAGSSEEWSPFFSFYVARNHMFWRVKHARARHAAGALLRLYWRAARMLGAQAWRGVGQVNGAESLELRVVGDVTRHLPELLRSRWRGR